MIENKKISDIVKRITENYAREKIILFGSHAAGTADGDSDLDLIIIKETDIPKQKRGRDFRRHLIGSLIPMDLKIYTPDEFRKEYETGFSFLNSAMKDSVLLLEREN